MKRLLSMLLLISAMALCGCQSKKVAVQTEPQTYRLPAIHHATHQKLLLEQRRFQLCNSKSEKP